MRRPRSTWPDGRARRALLYLVVLCTAVVLGLGVDVYGSVATWAVSPDTRHYFLGIPVDSLPLNELKQHQGARLLVILGEPPIFIAAIITLASIALLGRDRRLAYVAVIAPVTAEILTEIVAKPGFDRVTKIYSFYTYPSGHVTASASLMAVLALLIRRLAGRNVAIAATPFIGLYVAGSMVGVVVLHMHDLIDAVGGLAMGVGCVAFWAYLGLEWGSFTHRYQQLVAEPDAKTSAPTS